MSSSLPNTLTEKCYRWRGLLLFCLNSFLFLFSAINTSGPGKVVGPWGNTQGAPSPLRRHLEDSGIFPPLENVWLGVCECWTGGSSWSQCHWTEPKGRFLMFPPLDRLLTA